MDFKNEITKKCSLEHNDSISTYRGWGAQQNYNAFEVFYNFMKEVKPKRILEIGTSLGGLTQFLQYSSDELKLNTKILSLDIHEHSWYDDIIKMGVDLRIENIFKDGFNDIPQEYKDFINGEGITVILCDGGDKIREFNLLSNFIKKGDYILAHDYAYDKELFDREINQKIWNWHEISESDIKDSCEKNNLIDYERETFQSVVWVCKIKE
jgi:23S rRNA U2552 (ribose-2'-O)-methylase RlmE/FtsJ